ncbi:MAG: hypothetical protein DI536_29045 [Archangium gephyra]|uniref:Site-specific integrase n=1 Tax=Archangium gephyra TaxID=48 RepID=A0A2W5T4K4_9BACT|nr:MAG: hypothetical protein DI536_29045 [Archangium gephyra]
MGWVFKRGKTWHIGWRDAAGVQRRKATPARTSAEARALVAELEAQASRVALGLEAPPVKSRETLQQLCEWWLNERCPEPSRENERARLVRHVFRHELGETPLSLLTADAIEARFEAAEKSGGPDGRRLKPATINRLRTTLHSVFAAASQPPRRWSGANPVAATRIRDVERFHAVTLAPEQIAAVLPLVPDAWRGVMAVGAYMALRRGEIFALKKSDYDRKRQQLRVAASHQRNTTKGGRIDVLPVPRIVQPYLEQAARAKSLWLFPNSKGQQRTKESDPHLVLRTAVRAAGVVERWESWCRRCKAKHRRTPVLVTDKKPAPASCSTCGMKLWVRGVPPHIRFHDLRHSTATSLLRAGVPLQHVQRIMRHASIQTTVGIYGHMVTEDLRGSLDETFSPSSPSVAPRRPV